MSLYKYGIGGNEVEVDASESIADIPANRTIIAQQLTQEAPFTPDAVYGVTSPKEVFKKFKPTAKVNFETAEGEEKSETLSFENVGDFNAKAITQKSKFLNELNIEKEQYHKITKQLSSNRALMKALQNPETKGAVIQVIKDALNELATAKKEDA